MFHTRGTVWEGDTSHDSLQALPSLLLPFSLFNRKLSHIKLRMLQKAPETEYVLQDRTAKWKAPEETRVGSEPQVACIISVPVAMIKCQKQLQGRKGLVYCSMVAAKARKDCRSMELTPHSRSRAKTGSMAGLLAPGDTLPPRRLYPLKVL